MLTGVDYSAEFEIEDDGRAACQHGRAGVSAGVW
jgi:hypothetical protein